MVMDLVVSFFSTIRDLLRPISNEKNLNKIVLAKFFERIISREIFLKPISSLQNFSAK